MSLDLRGRPALRSAALCAALALAVASVASATAAVPASASSAPVVIEEPTLLALFDPEAPADVRDGARATLRTLAGGGDHAARCLLGRIAFRDAAYPRRADEGRPLVDDPVPLLTRCLLGGDVEAMLPLAELELRGGRPLEAAVWVQAYLKLTELLGEDWQASAGAYKAALLARIERRYGAQRPDNEEVLEYVAGFLATHGERILAACRAGGCQPWPALRGEASLRLLGSGRSSTGGMARDVARLEDNATVTYLLEVDEDGAITREWLVESYPTASPHRNLERAVGAARFAPAPAGTGPRYRWYTLWYDNGMLQLRPDAPLNERGRE